jgi:hypothetical protein
MLQVLALIILACIAADVSRRVHLSRAVFMQLSQPTSVAWMVWLYPVPFLLPLFAKSFFAFLLYRIPLGILFFIPALMSARVTRKCLELSGDGRVKPALAAIEMTTTAGIMGIMGVLVLTVLCWAFGWPKAYVH